MPIKQDESFACEILHISWIILVWINIVASILNEKTVFNPCKTQKIYVYKETGSKDWFFSSKDWIPLQCDEDNIQTPVYQTHIKP